MNLAPANILLASALALTSCSSDTKTPESKAPPPATAPSTPAPPTTAAGLADGPRTIERTALDRIVRQGQDGVTREWTSLGGIEVSDTDYKEVYQSRGESYVSFKATVKAGADNCLVHWKAELLDSKTGRGPSLGKIEGTVPVPANTSAIVSGLSAMAPAKAQSIGSASAGYWTLCGAALPSPSVFDVAITETEAKQIKFGKAFDLHHTRLGFESTQAASTKTPERCYFDMVVEDVDADGFTLNRDFASFGMAPGTRSSATLRRTTFEGGNEKDFEARVAGKRSYLRNFSCQGPWDKGAAKVEGLRISNLALHRYEGEPTTAEHFVRATFGHSATLQNTSGQDCSFRLRYRLLDTSGVPLNRAPVLSESVHLAKGAKVDYLAPTQRLFVWLDQAGEVGSVVVEQAGPIQACSQYEASKALQAGSKAPSGVGNQNQK